MEDVTIGYQRPAILDLKMGQVTYDPIAKPEKIEKERIKYPPQAKMGMRILGYRVGYFLICFEVYCKIFAMTVAYVIPILCICKVTVILLYLTLEGSLVNSTVEYCRNTPTANLLVKVTVRI